MLTPLLECVTKFRPFLSGLGTLNDVVLVLCALASTRTVTGSPELVSMHPYPMWSVAGRMLNPLNLTIYPQTFGQGANYFPIDSGDSHIIKLEVVRVVL
mmetsp:Transcript_13588/g.25459  ORF Transcript_13588/g.25459 Transcript_13588/m.25459 type:complete len:99 (-) Transcript_13588:207-503(-)